VNRNRVSPYKQRVNYRRDRAINQHRNVSEILFGRSRQSRARTPLRSCLRHGSTGLVDNAFVALASVTDNRNALSELFRLATCSAGLEVRQRTDAISSGLANFLIVPIVANAIS